MKTILAVMLVMASFYSFSQTKIYSTILKDATKKVLYLGLDNPFKVEGKEIDSKCNAYVDNGTIAILEDNRFVIKPNKIGIANVSFYKDGKLILSDKFDVQRISPASFEQTFKNLKIKRR